MSYRSTGLLTVFLGAAAATSFLQGQSRAALSMDLKLTKSPVSPPLYGLMTEEINYSYDGRQYAKLVRNRTFRSDRSGTLRACEGFRPGSAHHCPRRGQ